jgi:hypothetical protein
MPPGVGCWKKIENKIVEKAKSVSFDRLHQIKTSLAA